MKGYLDNLRPFEKRLVVGVGVLLFAVLNFWFVVPHFSDWGQVKIRMNKARATLAKYETEVRQIDDYKRKIASLQGEGLDVPPEDQAQHFDSAIVSQAAQSSVYITQSGRIQIRTNQFFLELSKPISVQAKEQQIVDFLFNLGSGNSLIRVRGLTLRTDQPRQQLMAQVTLVASYQKKATPRAATAAAPPVAAKTTPPPVKQAAPPVKQTAPGKSGPTNKPATSPGGSTISPTKPASPTPKKP